MGATTKRARKIRSNSEFDIRALAAELRAPRVNAGAYSWELDSIRDARAQQMLGRFRFPARLAEAMRTDSALFVAWLNRLAPERGLPVELKPANASARGLRVAAEGEALFGPQGVGVHPDTMSDIVSDLANHGVAFGINVWTPRADGSRVDVEHKAWPIEFVWWDQVTRCFRTEVDFDSLTDYRNLNEGRDPSPASGGVPIVHGAGQFVVYKKHEIEPWKKDAALLPGALLWADRAFGVRDRAKSSTAHGNAKIVGTMPEGLAIDSDEGRAFLELLKVIASVDTPVGLKPFGSTLDYITNNSQAWQIFKEIIDSNDKAASKIYLGQDGTTANTGGNYIKSDVLFGVRNDVVEGDLRALERGILTGVIEPWAAMNFGDSSLAPSRVYLMPDADEDARRTSIAERTKAFYEAIQLAKGQGFEVGQEYVNGLAKQYGVTPPVLPVQVNKGPTITLAPTDVARVVSVNEARASAGLEGLKLPNGALDPDGLLTVEEFSAKKAAKAANPTQPQAASWGRLANNPDEDRDKNGKWASGGGGSSSADHARKKSSEAKTATKTAEKSGTAEAHKAAAHAHSAASAEHQKAAAGALDANKTADYTKHRNAARAHHDEGLRHAEAAKSAKPETPKSAAAPKPEPKKPAPKPEPKTETPQHAPPKAAGDPHAEKAHLLKTVDSLMKEHGGLVPIPELRDHYLKMGWTREKFDRHLLDLEKSKHVELKNANNPQGSWGAPIARPHDLINDGPRRERLHWVAKN